VAAKHWRLGYLSSDLFSFVVLCTQYLFLVTRLLNGIVYLFEFRALPTRLLYLPSTSSALYLCLDSFNLDFAWTVGKRAAPYLDALIITSLFNRHAF